MLAAASFSLVAGLDPYRTQLAGLFALASSLLLANLVVGWLTRVRLAGALHVPARAVAGTMVRGRVELSNPSRRPAYDLEATLPQWLAGLGPGHESARVACLEPGQSAELEVFFAAHQRGSYRVGPVYAGSTYPLGILRLGNFVGAAQPLLVTPTIHPVRGMLLNSGMRYQPGGVPLASRTGESLEFVGVRDYLPGDSLRKIHWKLWARRLAAAGGPEQRDGAQDGPVVREFSQEYFSRIGLILDTHLPPTPAHFEAAVESVASVANFLARQDAIVDFFAAGPELYLLSMGRHLATLERVLEVLACVQPQVAPSPRRWGRRAAPVEAPYENLAPRLQQLLPRLSAVIFVTFGLNAQRRSFIERVRLGGAPLRLLVVAAPGETQEPDACVSYIDPGQVAAGLDQL